MSQEAVAKFVESLKSDPDLMADWPQDKPVSLADALDHTVNVAAQKGLTFSREELLQVIVEKASPESERELTDKQLQAVAGGFNFRSIHVGLSNRLNDMCQPGPQGPLMSILRS
jgi:hypothetical protein